MKAKAIRPDAPGGSGRHREFRWPADLPAPGPPFAIGEHVVFIPAVLGPPSMWLKLDEAVIDDIDEEAESFTFHFVSQPGVPAAQGLENVARANDTYRAWREAFESALAKSGDEGHADEETGDLWLRVLAEHPIHGPTLREREALP
jgi:hypothetical protein